MLYKTIKLSLPLVAILVFLIYFQAVNGPYIVDDMTNLVNNDSLIISEFNLESIKEAALSFPSGKFSRPISMLSFAANYSITGDKSRFSVKLTNIILHLIIGAGILILSRRLLVSMRQAGEAYNDNAVNVISILAAALWLSHPLFVSTVLYSIQRMAMLSAFFIVYGCIAYLYLRNKTIVDNKGHYTLLSAIPIITVTGYLAKENAFLLPGFMLLIEYYCFGFKQHERTSKYFLPALKAMLWAPVVFVLLYLIYTYLTNFNAELTNRTFDFNERVLTQTRILWHYLGWLTFLNPEPLGIYHDDIAISAGLTRPVTTSLSIIAWIVILFIAFKLNKYSRVYSFSLLWFLWGHSLESTVIPLAMVFEHRNYLPGYGPILALSALIGTFLLRHHARLVLSYLLLALFLLLPLSLLHERVQRWTDPQSFGLWLIKAHPQSVSALATAANYLSAAGDTRYSLEALEQARQLDPQDTAVFFNEIRILCENRPEAEFDPRIKRKIDTMPLNRVTASGRYYYNTLVNNCASSSINHDTLLSLYERYSHSDINKIAILSLYGKGTIYIRNNDPEKAARAWEKAVEIDPVLAQDLVPMLENIKADLRDMNTDRKQAN